MFNLSIHLFNWDSNRFIEINKYCYHYYCGGGNRMLRKITRRVMIVIIRMGSTGRNKFRDVDDSVVPNRD